MNLFFLHRFCLFALLLLAALGIAQAQQPGDIDQSFHHGQGHAFLQENGVGTGANNTIGVLAVQPDNKVLIGGLFTYYNGMIRNRIARLNADGSLDVNFNPTGSGANDEVSAVIVQSDGKVLIGGKFTSYNGTARNRITRLNADGSLDVNFNPTGSGANDEISAVIVQSDGKVLIGGRFTSYNGTARNRIARLNSDGSLDVNFNPIGSGANDEISALALQAGGKVVIGGEFTSYNGTSRSRIARLNADGSLDTGFNPGTGPDDAVFALALQPDGKVLIGGALTSFSGVTRNKIARLNVDGSLDTGFAPDTGANEDILSLILLSDGKVLIGGVFWAYDGISRNGVARLNANGSLDNAVFTPTGTGLNDQINALALQPDGPVVKVLIGGDFTTHNESGRNRIARL
ncbi:MAG: delta-60 repeat domain-containing protein, partial [Bacteroidetes bacterium]|nr:delta-60 repeat domain-containing protein [Bacteroidota bacterium]